jgi:hypothetical protein
MNKICITFAGAVGSSKTPITNFLSTKLNLPVFNNDAIRSEVTEDLGKFDSEEHLKRRNERLMSVLEDGTSFICDLSVDREWKDFKKQLSLKGYHVFIISLDLSKDFLVRLYESKEYFESLKRIDEIINDHSVFLDNYENDIALHIQDKDFNRRCQISHEEVSKWIKSKK